MSKLTPRAAAPLVLAALLPLVTACDRALDVIDESSIVVDLELPLSSADVDALPAATRATLAATLRVEGLVEAPLAVDIDARRVEGSFLVDVDEEVTRPFSLVLTGARSALTAAVPLAYLEGTLTIAPVSAVAVEGTFSLDPDAYPALDPNRNGKGSVEDLVTACDPALPEKFHALSDASLQFSSGTALGAFARQALIVSNETTGALTVTARVVDAPGVTLRRVATDGSLDAAPSLRELASVDVAGNGELVVAVTYAPATPYLTKGLLIVDASDACGVTLTRTVSLIGNGDAEVAPLPDGDVPVLGSTADLPIPSSMVQGLAAGDLTGNTLAQPPPVPAAYGEEIRVRDLPVDEAWLAVVPADTELHVSLSELDEDLDLAVFVLGPGDALPATPPDDEPPPSAHPGPSTEAVVLPASTTARRVLVVSGVADARRAVRAPDAPMRRALAAHLVTVPSFADPPCAPASGVVDGGETVTLRGRGFLPGATVLFGDVLTSSVVVSSDGTEITLVTPPGDLALEKNPVNIVVTNPVVEGRPVAEQVMLPEGFTYVPGAPVVVAVDPDVIPQQGGIDVVITGQSFADRYGTPVVLFGDSESPSVTFVDTTRLVAEAPAHVPGVVDVTVRNLRSAAGNFAEGTLASAVTYTAPTIPPPTVSALAPSTGPVTGGTPVTITGSDFVAPLTVHFGALSASDVVVVSTSELTAVSPPGAVGAVLVRVVDEYGQEAAEKPPFTYVGVVPTGTPTIVTAVPSRLHAFLDGDVVTLFGGSLDARPITSASFVDDAGATHAAGLVSISASVVQVVVADPLPEGSATAVLTFDDGSTASSPPLEVAGPLPLATSVIAGTAQEGSAFTLLVTGTDLMGARVDAVRFTGPTVVDLAPTTASDTFVRVDVAAGALAQGSYALALVYDDDRAVDASLSVDVDGECGNGTVEPGEQCDGVALVGATCASLGFVGGALGCTSACTYDTALCSTCGDGVKDVGDACDGTDLGGLTCADVPGRDHGTLACTAQCTLDGTACSTCENGVLEGSELCDVGVLGGATCASVLGAGYTGTLACGASCDAFDPSACVKCGDGVCGPTETNASCPGDCAPSCGDDVCSAPETCQTCPGDCDLCAPYTIEIDDGDGQHTRPLDGFPLPLVVRVTDEQGLPVPNVIVQWTGAPGAVPTPSSSTTLADGRASTVVNAPFSLGPTAVSVTATSPDGTAVQGLPLAFNLIVDDVPEGTIFTVLNRPATAAQTITGYGPTTRVYTPTGVTFDAAGSLYVADTSNHRVVKMTKDGVTSVFAGTTSTSGSTGNGGPATAARLSAPKGVAADDDGNIYIADSQNARIRRVDPAGVITEFAGGGTTTGSAGDGGTANQMGLSLYMTQLVVKNGVLYGSDSGLFRIRAIDLGTTIVSTPLDGTGTCTNGATAYISVMSGVGVDDDGNVFGAAYNTSGAGTCGVSGYTLMQARPDGLVKLHPGMGFGTGNGNSGILADRGVVYGGSSTGRIWRVDRSGYVTVVAGTGTSGGTLSDYVDATLGKINQVGAIAQSPDGRFIVYPDPANHVVRAIRVADGGYDVDVTLTVSGGDDQDAGRSRPLTAPITVSVTASGTPVDAFPVFFTRPPGAHVAPTLVSTNAGGVATTYAWVGLKPGPYVFEAGITDVFDVDLPQGLVTITANAIDHPAGTVVTVVNEPRGVGLVTPPSGPASQAKLDPGALDLNGIARLPDGGFVLAENGKHRIVRVDVDGEIHAVAGSGAAGFGGDGGQALNAVLSSPRDLETDAAGNIFFVDQGNARVRRIDATTGVITTVAGGAPDSSGHGDGLLAIAAHLGVPSGLALSPAGEMWITETSRCNVRFVDASGIISTVSGAGQCGQCATGESENYRVSDVEYDPSTGTALLAVETRGPCVHVTDNLAAVGVARIDGPSAMTFVATGLPTVVNVGSPIAARPDGAFYVADTNRIYRVTPPSLTFDLVSGTASTGYSSIGTIPSAQFSSPIGLSYDGAEDTLLVVDGANDAVRMIVSP